MFKKSTCIILILSLIFQLSGCWDYRGLNDMAIVIGIAVDKDPISGNYQLSFEVADLSVSIKDKGLSGKLIESEGKTVFDAIRNAKKRVNNKLYFGQTQIVVFSEAIARSEDFSGIIDWFLRDGEMRGTINVLISQEQSARDIIKAKGIGLGIISAEIEKIVENDDIYTSSISHVEFYQVFNILSAEGKSLTLPVIHNVFNNGETNIEVNGTAVFKGKKLIGYISSDESKYFLFAIDEIQGGIMTLSSKGDGHDDISLEISKNTTKRSFEFVDGKIKILIHTDTTVYLGEAIAHNDALDEKAIAALEDTAETTLENNISHVIQKVQLQYDSDIFGFGNMIYKKDFRLWNQLKDTWAEQFKVLEVEVQSDVHIVNTGSIEKS